MNRAFSVKSLLVAVLAISGAASAAEHAAAPAKADAAKGATLYADGDNARGLPACASCHGASGNSTIAVNPKLSGQPEAYLYKQLVNFTTPARNNPVMTTYAKMLSDTIELGKKIYRGGIAEKSVPACASCHGPAGGGIPALYPRLAGQHQDYTTAQLTAFRQDGRKNSPEMSTIAKRLSDDEIKAVSDYVAGLK
jgi:cytochrome c553